MDAQSIAILSAVTGASIGTIAAILIAALVGRFVYRTFRDFDELRTLALKETRAQLDEARERIAELELERRRMRGYERRNEADRISD